MATARKGSERGRGVPLTDVQRAERHYATYGTTTVSIRGTGLSWPSWTPSVPWWGWLFLGGAVGAGIVYFVKR